MVMSNGLSGGTNATRRSQYDIAQTTHSGQQVVVLSPYQEAYDRSRLGNDQTGGSHSGLVQLHQLNSDIKVVSDVPRE